MKQLQAKKINEKFNSFVRSERDRKNSNYDASLVLELTGPDYVGGATRDTNGDNLTVQLIQKTYTAESIQVLASQRSSLVSVFFRADAQERGDCYRGTLVVYRNKKNQRDYFTIPKGHYTSDYERDVKEKVQHRLGFGWKSDLEKSENKEALLALLESISIDLCYSSRISKQDSEALASLGVKIERVMEFTHEIQFNPKFIKENKTSTLFGWMSFGTYSSHPMTLKISKSKSGVELIRLADFGAESSGYYDHHNKHTCKPEHVQALKSFARSFKALTKKGVV